VIAMLSKGFENFKVEYQQAEHKDDYTDFVDALTCRPPGEDDEGDDFTRGGQYRARLQAFHERQYADYLAHPAHPEAAWTDILILQPFNGHYE
jgi:hypothetical protein